MIQPSPVRSQGPRLGVRANLGQFSLLVGVNALVGQERSLLSLLATKAFGLAVVSAALTYMVAPLRIIWAPSWGWGWPPTSSSASTRACAGRPP